MLELKEIQDVDKKVSYECMTSFEQDKNGFINDAYGLSYEEYDVFLDRCMKDAKGIDMPSWKVPMITYILMDNCLPVGVFKVRPNLNEALRNGSGHIGYGICKKDRQKGYATKGLALAIEKVKEKSTDKEVYLSVNKNNKASLKVQLNNGAYIHHEDESKVYTRIKI